MSISGYKRLSISLAIVCVGLIVLSGWLFVREGMLRVRVALADAQIEIIEEMRTKAMVNDVGTAAGCLEYAVRYYPSGTKQEAGSRLDRLVEHARTRAVRDMVAYLRSKTGENLGDDPEPWIEKYAHH